MVRLVDNVLGSTFDKIPQSCTRVTGDVTKSSREDTFDVDLPNLQIIDGNVILYGNAKVINLPALTKIGGIEKPLPFNSRPGLNDM